MRTEKCSNHLPQGPRARDSDLSPRAARLRNMQNPVFLVFANHTKNPSAPETVNIAN